jgi:hypothetical protein
MMEMRNINIILDGKPEGKRPLGRLSVDGKIILKWIFLKSGLGVWIRFILLRIGSCSVLL